MTQQIINTILIDGSFFEGEFDFKNNQPKTTDEVRNWFIERYKIKNQNSAFIEFYNLVGSPPVGNGPILYDLDQINQSKDNFGGELLLLIASGDTGSYVYHTSSDKVYEYDFMVNRYDDIKDGKTPCVTWENFSAFLDAYYA